MPMPCTMSLGILTDDRTDAARGPSQHVVRVPGAYARGRSGGAGGRAATVRPIRRGVSSDLLADVTKKNVRPENGTLVLFSHPCIVAAAASSMPFMLNKSRSSALAMATSVSMRGTTAPVSMRAICSWRKLPPRATTFSSSCSCVSPSSMHRL